MLELNNIYNCDCRDGLKELEANSVDLTLTSPPYDSLRTYKDDEFAWNFDIFKEVANELYRVTKPGGVVVWVVGDEVVNGGETGTSFRQALYFQELGFKIHDTMIYEKNSSTFPARITSKRYSQIFEYMFVFVKGKKIRDDIKLIADKRNKWAGWTNWGTKTYYDKEGNLIQHKMNNKPTPEFSLRTNIWKYAVAFNDKTGHPAVFPEKLAEDHILSWTNEGDTVLDPFMGSGTTAKMATLNKRNYIGFEKNEEYYEVSLKRVGKYAGKVNDTITEVAVNDSEGNSDTLQFNTASDNEEEGKTEIFNEIVGQLNEYLNDMSLSILKTLKLTFATKANDRRVEQVLKERGLFTGSTETAETVVPAYCEGAKQEEIGDVRGKRTYEAPKVLAVTDVPKGDFISDLTLPNGGYYVEPDLETVVKATILTDEPNKMGRVYPREVLCKMASELNKSDMPDKDKFINDFEEIGPKEITYKQEKQPLITVEAVTHNSDEQHIPLTSKDGNVANPTELPSVLCDTPDFWEKIRGMINESVHDVLTSLIPISLKEAVAINQHLNEVVGGQPVEDSGISVIEMGTMDPVQVLPDSLNKAIENGEAYKTVEVLPMSEDFTPETIGHIGNEETVIVDTPKKKRGRPKGSKNKPKTIQQES